MEGAAGQGRRGCSLGFPTQGLKPLCRFLDPDPHRVSFWAPARAAAPAPRAWSPSGGTRRRVSKVASFKSLPYFSSTAAERAAASQRCLRDPFGFSGASAVTSSTSLPPTSSLLQKANAVTSAPAWTLADHRALASTPGLRPAQASPSCNEALWACMPNAPRKACCLRAPGSSSPHPRPSPALQGRWGS